MWAPTKQLNALAISDREKILTSLEDLRSNQSGITWILMGYNSKSEVELLETGTGGFDNVKERFPDDDVRYAVVEVVVKGDMYSPVKFVLITWIGSKVTPGLGKARCAGHRQELLDFVKTKVGIAGEFQPSTRSELTSEDLAAKLTRIRKQDTTDVDQSKHQIARPTAKSGDTSKSQAKLVNESDIKDACIRVHKGQDKWCALGYVEGKKDEITYLKSGSNLGELKSLFPADKIIYVMLGQLVTETTTITTKFLLITMVGERTGPLVKARSGPQRAELVEFIKQFMPFHSHYQALSVNDLSEEKFLEKLRVG